jgi:hypothetical protein
MWKGLIKLALDMAQYKDLQNTVMSPKLNKVSRNSVTSKAIIRLSRRTLIHGVMLKHSYC